MPHARFGAAVAKAPVDGFVLSLDVITMVGAEFVLMKPRKTKDPETLVFPSSDFLVDESPADAARRVVEAWTGTKNPKLELVDWRVTTSPWEMAFVFRALLIDEPVATDEVESFTRVNRMDLPAQIGRLEGAWVQEALKTGLNYKLTRSAVEGRD